MRKIFFAWAGCSAGPLVGVYFGSIPPEGLIFYTILAGHQVVMAAFIAYLLRKELKAYVPEVEKVCNATNP